MIQDYDGDAVFDVSGNQIGTVEQSYDDANGVTRYVEIKMGTVFAKHRLAPVEGIQETNEGIQVPYTKDQIEGSPDAKPASDTLDGDLLSRVRDYFDGLPTTEEGRPVAAIPAREESKR